MKAPRRAAVRTADRGNIESAAGGMADEITSKGDGQQWRVAATEGEAQKLGNGRDLLARRGLVRVEGARGGGAGGLP